MPLSEHEQRILAELEESLSKQDPRFAKNVARPTSIPTVVGACVGESSDSSLSGLLILISFSPNRSCWDSSASR
jgi:hypothetical protein